MGWYYRKRKGGMNFSLSRRGPRMSVGFGGKGCLLSIMAAATGIAGMTFLLAIWF